MDSLLLPAHQGGDFLLYDFNELLRRGKAGHHFLTDRSLLNRLDEILDHFKIDVGLQEGDPYLFQGLLDILFGQFPMASQSFKNTLEFCRKALKHLLHLNNYK